MNKCYYFLFGLKVIVLYHFLKRGKILILYRKNTRRTGIGKS